MLLFRMLTTLAHFEAALAAKASVAVYRSGRLLEPGAPLQLFNEHTVKIRGNYYFRDECQFESCQQVRPASSEASETG
ncbi:hypothetical protein ACLBWT_01635 [Paenibacillus sp. D51F]|uniref:hypothetical protein n=1 Tax=unclassified Paenibacillus TaxID=185978 RepID=UPI0009555620|nr:MULTISPECIES: hypothetical protein [unclassified Paenibacillus]ASS65898.1 hypothetical protein CIC07_06890 [Paenibacillus sp. RUD330]SIQ19680.1 hypothetical protein SAMN05880555_0981 [Paenibacillus sp. RU4X]SIQ41305.1 hypothetical protein SAMN05880570_0980 [Paenibacillus sp. RU4T]